MESQRIECRPGVAHPALLLELRRVKFGNLGEIFDNLATGISHV